VEKILDMCAAPGGKVTHICHLMKNQGTVIAFDKSESKVKQIEELLKQQNITICKAVKMNATHAKKRIFKF